MSSPYVLTEAEATDAYAIASLFALSWNLPFAQLQFGNVDAFTLAQSLAPNIAEQMKHKYVKYVVIRRSDTQEVVSAAQWALPVYDNLCQVYETSKDREEREQFEDEIYRNKLPEGSNKDLIMEFGIGQRKLREQALRGATHYLLENIATYPQYRSQGLATRLIEWVFLEADKSGVLVYLDAASNNPAMRLYEKLGFEEVGRNIIDDLSRYGGKGSETYIAMIRCPKKLL
ncbi:acyl-CoA N-acyltransferase [Lojkania enalia]|uniref:Acyl-CoA N-acyltransferase n=1 Tax=Lojkania enalia TaxID=147567 RepID=A0A9P4N4E1_9PLEO|nr:acyl-CoA N-acyltransferase [Didymosphaeria enalia]